MTRVASNQLYAVHITDNAAHTVYTVPANHRTILKSVVVRSLAAAAQIVTVAITDSSGVQVAAWTYNLAAVGTSGDSEREIIWVVLLPGQHLVMQCGSASGCYAVASGSELDLGS